MSILETYNNRPRKLWVRILIFLVLFILAVWSANGINLGSRMELLLRGLRELSDFGATHHNGDTII